MKKSLAIAFATVVTGALAGPALADDDARCGNVAAADWLSVADITQKATDAGYAVREVERDDGCYDVKATDNQNRKVEVRMHPGTGAVIVVDQDD